jgi:hypothetical protein
MTAHEETWEVGVESRSICHTPESFERMPKGAYRIVLSSYLPTDPREPGRMRLAAHAPEMARFLLAIADGRDERRENLRQAHQHPGEGENLDTDLIRDLLKRAGVIE